jgi:RsiW-degrading membrane proteinase PrsW (M82 family)
MSPGSWASIAGSLLLALAWLAYFYRSRRASTMALGMVFFTAGLLAAPCALLVFQLLELSEFYALLGTPGLAGETKLFVYSLFAIGPVEELAKFSVVLLVIRLGRLKVPSMTAALAWATAAALGFAAAENAYHSFLTQEFAWHRAITLPFNHVLFSSFWGVGIYHDATHDRGRIWIFLTLALASVYHGLYDYILLSEAIHSIFVVPIIGLLYFWLNRVFKSPVAALQSARE